MTTSTPSPSGDRVRALRGRQGLTQTDLARKADISPTTIATMETGERRVRPATVRRIARALGVSPAELFDADEVAAAPKNQSLRESHSEPAAGDSSFDEPRLSVQDWRDTLESLATLYEQAEEELRKADPGVFPNKVIDVAVLAGHHLRLLSREADEVREAPGVVAAEKRVRRANASVERMIDQFLNPMDEAHVEQSARFKRAAARGVTASYASIGERESGDDRAQSAS